MVIAYPFQVLNTSGTPQTGIAFSNGGFASPGLSVLTKVPSGLGGSTSGLAITPAANNVSFVEYGSGYYAILFDADAFETDCFAVVDAGVALSGANRYIGVSLNRDSSRIALSLPPRPYGQPFGLPIFNVGNAPTDNNHP